MVYTAIGYTLLNGGAVSESRILGERRAAGVAALCD